MKDKKVIRNSQHRSTKGKSCLIKLMAFCRKIIGDVDKERAVILINIDFNEAFDTVSLSSLVCKLRRCEQDKWAATHLAGLADIAISGLMSGGWRVVRRAVLYSVHQHWGPRCSLSSSVAWMVTHKAFLANSQVRGSD